MIRLLAWILWQLFVLAFVFVVWASKFGEYGLYHQPVVEWLSLALAFGLAVVAGTVIPFRRWRKSNQQDSSSAARP